MKLFAALVVSGFFLAIGQMSSTFNNGSTVKAPHFKDSNRLKAPIVETKNLIKAPHFKGSAIAKA